MFMNSWEKQESLQEKKVLSNLALIFITLKLCGVITWKWGMVLLPLWIEIGIIVLYIVLVMIKEMLEKRK